MGYQAGTPVGHTLRIQAGPPVGHMLYLQAGTPVGPQSIIMLGCDKHSPGSGPLWGAGRTNFPALYKALVGVPDELGRKEKRDLRARVLCASTSVKRARRSLHTYDREGCPFVTQ